MFVCCRLKYLLRKAEREEICREELLVHLNYVVCVLDNAFSDESKSVNIFLMLQLLVGSFDIKS